MHIFKISGTMASLESCFHINFWLRPGYTHVVRQRAKLDRSTAVRHAQWLIGIVHTISSHCKGGHMIHSCVVKPSGNINCLARMQCALPVNLATDLLAENNRTRSTNRGASGKVLSDSREICNGPTAVRMNTWHTVLTVHLPVPAFLTGPTPATSVCS